MHLFVSLVNNCSYQRSAQATGPTTQIEQRDRFFAGYAPVDKPVFLTFGCFVVSGGKAVSVSAFLSSAFQRPLFI